MHKAESVTGPGDRVWRCLGVSETGFCDVRRHWPTSICGRRLWRTSERSRACWPSQTPAHSRSNFKDVWRSNVKQLVISTKKRSWIHHPKVNREPYYMQLKGCGCFDGYSSESLSLQGRLKVTNTSSRSVSGCGRPPIVIIMLDQKIAEIILLLPQTNRAYRLDKVTASSNTAVNSQNMTWPEDGVRIRVDRVVMDRPVFTAYTTCTQRSLQRNRASLGIVLKCLRLYILANYM